MTGCRKISEILASVDTEEGRRRVADYLEQGPFPHFFPDPKRPGFLIRIEADGTRTTGRFVSRRFLTAR
jgi:hypothetical protein